MQKRVNKVESGDIKSFVQTETFVPIRGGKLQNFTGRPRSLRLMRFRSGGSKWCRECWGRHSL